MNTKTVIIIDDEPAARSNLRAVIDTFEELSVIAEVGDGKSAIDQISKLQPDIVFLDIEMPEVDGFDVARATSDLNYQLVFVTAYDQYALDAFNTNAIDYLVKPVRPQLIEKCIKKMLYQQEMVLEGLEKQKTQSDSLVLSDGNAVRILNLSHICFIEGIGRYRRIHLTQSGEAAHRVETIISDTTLDDFESQLPQQKFIRMHRSYLVNISQITSLLNESRRHFVSLKDNPPKIPVSRQKVKNMKALFQD